MTTYIKDLIDLPEKVHGGDFVLKLTEGVGQTAKALAPYEVAIPSVERFDAVLALVKSTVQANSSDSAWDAPDCESSVAVAA